MRPTVRAGVVTLKYLDHTTKPNGRVYWYFRRGKGPRIPMPDLPHDHPDFLRAYANALAAVPAPKSRALPGSVRSLCELAMRTDRAKRLSPSYRAMLRRHFEAISAEVGAAPASGVKERHIRVNLSKSENKTDRLKAWRFWTRAGIEAGLISTDPAAPIRPSEKPGEGHTVWSQADIEAYRKRWPIGTVPRAALELLFWTGARLGDAVMIGPQMVDKRGVLTYRQSKTKDTAHCPWTCTLPAYAASMEADRIMMREAIAPLAGHLTFLAAHGRTRSSKALGTMIRESAAAAGLTGLSAHGLRKARAVALANAGATVHQIVAWTGHRTLKEAERYTRSADRLSAVIGEEQEQNRPNQTAITAQLWEKS